MKKIGIYLYIVLYLLFTVSILNTKATVSKTVITGAVYEVEEEIESKALEYGLASVYYHHDKAYSTITSSEHIIGYECGGSTYGSGSLTLNKPYSQNVNVLEVSKDANAKIVVWSCIKNGHWTLATILEIAKDYEEKHPGYKVIAGVNGDFFDINADDPYPYTVLGTMVADGTTFKVGTGWPLIGFKNDESLAPIINVMDAEYESKPKVKIYDEDDKLLATFDADKINEEITNGETGIYYGLYEKQGKNHYCNTLDVSESFIIDGESAVTVAYSNESFYGSGTITRYGSSTLKDNQFALKTKNEEVLSYLKPNVKVEVEYSLTGALANCENVTGAVATFLKDSSYAKIAHSEYMDYRYPRTLAGYREDGSLVFAVTDGRNAPSGYYGLNGIESAAQMLHYGCKEAYSFDGGGSTTMVILEDGELKCVNHPSDGGLRRDGNAVLIVTRVPSLEIDYTSKPNEVTIMVNELEELTGFDNYYVSLNGQVLALVDNKATFSNLSANTSYKYTLFIQKGDKLGMMPYSGEVFTQKVKFEKSGITLTKVDGDYELSIDIKDDDNCIITSVFILDGKRISSKKGKYTITKDMLSSMLLESDSYLIITYQLSSHDERVEERFDLNDLKLNDVESAVSYLSDMVSSILESYLD